jgi:hypothetical protein
MGQCLIKEQSENIEPYIGDSLAPNNHMFQLIKLDVALTMTATSQHKKSHVLAF